MDEDIPGIEGPNEYNLLTSVHHLLLDDGKVDEDMLISGAIVIGIYTTPDGNSTCLRTSMLGGADYYTQRGVFDYMLQLARLETELQIADMNDD